MAKIRMGFVTNSSSSSFIVTFNSIPTSVSETQIMLFGHDGDGMVEVYDRSMTVHDVASRVFDDIKNQQPNDIDKIKDSYEGYDEEAPRQEDYTKNYHYSSKEYRKALDQYYEESKKYRIASAKRFIKQNRGKYIFVFRYADDSGEVVLEHGDIFQNLPHKRISNH